MIVRMSILAAAAFLVASAQPVCADAPGYVSRVSQAPSRGEERIHRQPSRRFPTEGFHRVERRVERPYGPAPIVRAYLPRNHAVPMYNEPPPR